MDKSTATAEEENICNSLEENTTVTLHDIVQKQQQSYESFVSNFTYLTIGDIEKCEERKLSLKLESDKSSIGNSCLINVQNDSSSSTNLEKNNTKHPNVTSEDELEEEVLGEDMKIHTEEVEEPKKPKRNFAKFDNFVTNEDIDDDDDDISDIGSGYLASFQSDSNIESENSRTPDHTKHQAHKLSFKIVCKNSVIPKSIEAEKKLSNLNCDTNVARCSFQSESEVIVYPGEAEREVTSKDLKNIQHITCLEYSCKFADSIDRTEEKNSIVPSCTDEVEEFRLDDNFDYDNVILTPKYSLQEMNYLSSLRENAQSDYRNLPLY